MGAPAGSPDLPAPLRRFAALYEEGRYWDSHEVLEDPWRERGSRFYQGLILYASAFVHHRRANLHGVRAQLAKAEAALGPYSPHYLGVDVARLLRHAEQVRRRLDTDDPGWARRIEAPPLELDPALVRGDEPELATGPSAEGGREGG